MNNAPPSSAAPAPVCNSQREILRHRNPAGVKTSSWASFAARFCGKVVADKFCVRVRQRRIIQDGGIGRHEPKAGIGANSSIGSTGSIGSICANSSSSIRKINPGGNHLCEAGNEAPLYGDKHHGQSKATSGHRQPHAVVIQPLRPQHQNHLRPPTAVFMRHST